MNVDDRLLSGARKIASTCLDVKKGEKVLIITDPGVSFRIGEALFAAVEECCAVPSILFVQPPAHPGGDPNEFACKLMAESDVIITPTSKTLFHCPAAKRARAAGARLASLSEIDEDVFTHGAIEADFAAHLPLVEEVARRYTEGKNIRYTTPAGTDITASIEGRAAVANSSICRDPGDAQGIPDIEVYIAPVEGTANGRLVIDASCSTVGKIESPIVLTVENGAVTSIEGGEEAEKLRATLERVNDPSAYNLAEMAVGLNPNARITGKIIEDEGKYGTCHCAVGSNLNFGGVNDAPVHIDMVQWHPTIIIDGEAIFRDGESLVTPRGACGR